ncbi:MAG: hypothetical protein MUP85_03425, partial [Candidatus Lokiarchaeota archaeon]|nr:hypothetical protein [Candidatus Lokiarchaeota archaeon]
DTDAITKFDIQLTNGTHFQPFMEGKFVITGEASENIIRLELVFNDVKVFEEDGQNLIFSFNTNNFSKGNVNITLKGHTNQGKAVQITRNCIFIGPELRYSIIGVASSIVVIGSIMWVRSRRKKKLVDDIAIQK